MIVFTKNMGGLIMKKLVIFMGVLLAGVTIGAATGSKITAELRSQKVNYNGSLSNQEVISYNGSTYVPLKSFGELVDIPVSYNKGIIYLGSSTTETYLSELIPYNTSDYEDILGARYNINKDMVIANKKYTNGVQLRPSGYQYRSIYYNLNGKFSSLSGIVGLDDKDNAFNFEDPVEVRIYCDGNRVYSTEFIQGDLEKELDISIVGCKQLRIEVGCISNNHPYVDFVNTLLK